MYSLRLQFPCNSIIDHRPQLLWCKLHIRDGMCLCPAAREKEQLTCLVWFLPSYGNHSKNQQLLKSQPLCTMVSYCPAAGAQPSVPGVLGVFVPNWQTCLLLFLLQVQSAARLSVCTGDACADCHIQRAAFSSTHMEHYLGSCKILNVEDQASFLHFGVWSSLVEVLIQQTLSGCRSTCKFLDPLNPGMDSSATPAWTLGFRLASSPSLRFASELRTHRHTRFGARCKHGTYTIHLHFQQPVP